MRGLGALVLRTGPVHVDPDDARERIHRELSKPEYHEGEGFLAWLLRTIEEWLQDLVGGIDGGSGTGIAIAVVVAILVVVAVVLLARRSGLLRRSSALAARTALTAQPELSGEQLRDSARAAAAEQRPDDAVVLGLRALVRDLEERTLLDVSAGMTAHEAADGAARSFPELRTRLAMAAGAFDTAAYSRRSPTDKQVEDVLRLAEYMAQATPDLAGTTAGAPE